MRLCPKFNGCRQSFCFVHHVTLTMKSILPAFWRADGMMIYLTRFVLQLIIFADPVYLWWYIVDVIITLMWRLTANLTRSSTTKHRVNIVEVLTRVAGYHDTTSEDRFCNINNSGSHFPLRKPTPLSRKGFEQPEIRLRLHPTCWVCSCSTEWREQ